jgi:hypothetical protein
MLYLSKKITVLGSDLQPTCSHACVCVCVHVCVCDFVSCSFLLFGMGNNLHLNFGQLDEFHVKLSLKQ